MKPNSNAYYKKKTSLFVKNWKTTRNNKSLFAFKRALSFALPFSFIFIFWEVGFSEKFFYKFPLFFFINMVIYFTFAYFISYKLNEKNYQKYKNQEF
ncbi:hypothetical protein [Tenacibaculum retecalamus]|uniref:hypothetical protein n=1 Tax=Tenacibaculum retecalamus TaxID=3018315 RepID=UPI0023D968E3|nr:hypothetical protein [Tenacibaculum retecalamus]WBX72044.1 hypothetical protein PG912_04565 [Tenacibaculum retecalamus]